MSCRKWYAIMSPWFDGSALCCKCTGHGAVNKWSWCRSRKRPSAHCRQTGSMNITFWHVGARARCVCGSLCVYMCVWRFLQECISSSVWIQPTVLVEGRWLREMSQWGAHVSLRKESSLCSHTCMSVFRPHPSVNPLSFTVLSHRYILALIASQLWSYSNQINCIAFH